MNTPVTALFYISVGALIMGALDAALLARSSGHTRSCWLFSAICLLFAVFQLCNANQYMLVDAASALTAHKFANFASILAIPLISYLLASLDHQSRSLNIAHVVTILAIPVMFYNYMSPYGYRFDSLYPGSHVTQVWGEALNIFSGEISWIYRAVRLTSLGVLLYVGLYAAKMSRKVGPLPSCLIWISIVLMLCTTSLAGLSDTGTMKIPYLGGFGFLFLAAAFSVLIRADVSNKKMEAQRVNQALEREVHRHKIANQRFEHVLHNDLLTKLPNRAGALIKLERLIESNRISQTKLGVFLIDLDRFGIINGTRGHKAGDQLLMEVAERLQYHVRESDLIARLGSGEFVVGVSGLRGEDAIYTMHEKLSEVLIAPFSIAGSVLEVTSSTGVALFPDDATNAEQVLAAAELALHHAKSCGPGHLRIFQPSLRDNIKENIEFESALKEALDQRQFFLHYQPQIHAANGRLACFEALIRWQHPTLGVVMPDKFIPLAESLGLISCIGNWAIDSACEQLARWRAMGYADLRVAINVSAQQLLVSDLTGIVSQALARYDLAGHDIELEITESVLMQDPERSIERLAALRKLGVRLSIDDFGTGYSSLSYLRVLPVHAFKLDRSFVGDIGKGGKDLEICATAIALAHNLSLEIVAEGVETEAQAHLLRELGCHLLQGYYFSRPLSVEAATYFLAAAGAPLPSGEIPAEGLHA